MTLAEMYTRSMKSINNKRVFKYLTVGLWMVIIFILSGKLGAKSGALSGSTIADVKAYLPSLSEQVTTILVRKSAHIFMYSVLGLLLANLLSDYRLSRRAVVGYGVLVAAIYASFDEIHQYFVGGRSSSPRDVLIDLVGVLIGIGIYLGLQKLIQARKTKQKVVG